MHTAGENKTKLKCNCWSQIIISSSVQSSLPWCAAVTTCDPAQSDTLRGDQVSHWHWSRQQIVNKTHKYSILCRIQNIDFHIHTFPPGMFEYWLDYWSSLINIIKLNNINNTCLHIPWSPAPTDAMSPSPTWRHSWPERTPAARWTRRTRRHPTRRPPPSSHHNN